MKRSSSLLISIVLASFAAAGCQSRPVEEKPSDSGPARSAANAVANVENPVERPDDNPGWEKKEPLALSAAALQTSEERFDSHSNYLSLPTPFEPVRSLHKDLQSREGVKLKNRGEAHITVITPPEFKVLSEAGVRMGEVEKTAIEMGLMQSDLEPVCVGMGQAMVGPKVQRTYFIVMRSETLLKIRRQVEALANQRAGRSVAFEADHFYPHITVGFTKDDLHEQQGVIKGKNSCLYPISVR